MKFFSRASVLLLWAAFSLNAENTTDSSNWEHGCHELEGSYAYEISGKIGPTKPPANEFNEAGTIYFDCNGCGHASGVSTITYDPTTITTPNVLHPEYTFTYAWSSPSLVFVTAKRSDALGNTNVVFAVGVGDKAEHISLILLPNATITNPTNTTTVITPAQAIWNYVQVSGTGGE